MKLAVLISGGRTGSDFFQSLLDGHEEILSFPGIFYFDKFLKELKINKKNPGNLFIEMNKAFFDSRLNLRERHNQLGKNKNEFYIVSKIKFLQIFNKKYKENDDNFDILIKLHQAYAYAKGDKLKKKKLIFLHIHHWQRLENLKDLNFTVLYTLRDPLINLSSAFKNWTNYNHSKLFSYHQLCFYYDRIRNGIEYCNRSKKRDFYIIKLEDLHKKNINLMKKFCKLFKLKKNKCLNISSFHNKKWWGDSIGNRYLNGVNINYKSSIDQKLFYDFDIKYLKSKMNNIYYDYYNQKHIKKINYFFRPLKMELLLLKSDLKKFKIFSIFKFIYYSILRYRLLNKKIKHKNPKNLIDI